MPQIPRRLPTIIVLLVLAGKAFAADFPTWAYPVNPPAGVPVPDDGKPLHVPDSAVTFRRSELALKPGTIIPDWHPGEHPAMPEVVSHGREPKVFACAYCHLPNGAGRPENASLAGLTPAYFKQQMLAFRNDERPGSDLHRLPQTNMVLVAKGVTDTEIDAAAAYFASLKPVSFVKVVEADTVPKTVVAGWMLARAPGGGTEPIGNRIIEIAEDFERFENRDSRTPYTAYVPVGSLQRGAVLVASGGEGRTVLCALCHGADLRGLADIPRLAGRSPGYLFRQLYDMRNGNRTGAASVLMKTVVANLTDEDMVAIAAYIASREP